MLSKRQIFVNLSILTMLITNILATTLPIGGITTAEISNKYFNYFVPAGYVFSIWGVIYLGLIAFAIYQSLKANRNNSIINSISTFVIINTLANAAWIFTWHYEILWLSVIIMGVILYTLLRIFNVLVVENKKVLSNRMNWFVKYPFSLYLGWISVATIANISAFLVSISWNGFGISPILWSVIMITIAAILSIYLLLNYKEFIFTGVIVWSLIGIYVNQDIDLIRGSIISALAILLVLASLVKLRLYK